MTHTPAFGAIIILALVFGTAVIGGLWPTKERRDAWRRHR